jgi:hypothetical protein
MSAMGFGIRAALNARLVRENRRSGARHRYNGNDTWIRVQGSLSRLCQVLDLSRTGVRLAVTSAHNLPDTFTLILSKNSGGSRLARVKWCRGTELGAEFVTPDSSPSHSPAGAPKANPSSGSRPGADAAKINSSQASRLTAGAPGAEKRHENQLQRSGNLTSTLSLRAPAQAPDLAKPKVDLGAIGGDKVKSDVARQTTLGSALMDRADQGKNSKKRMDLSRLLKKLGPKHVALIDAVKDLDPESAHGRELASIIEGLDKNRASQPVI